MSGDDEQITITDPYENNVMTNFSNNVGETIDGEPMVIWNIRALKLKPGAVLTTDGAYQREDMDEVDYIFSMEAGVLPELVAGIHGALGADFTEAVMIALKQVKKMRQAGNN